MVVVVVVVAACAFSLAARFDLMLRLFVVVLLRPRSAPLCPSGIPLAMFMMLHGVDTSG